MEEEEGMQGAANSEIRYIALELMKLAQKSGRKFEDVASEYMRNAEKLAEMIAGHEEPAGKKEAGRASSKER